MKRVIITGASSGIGQATAKLFIQNGFQVGLISRSEIKIDGDPKNLMKISCDVRDYSQVANAHQYFLDHFGGFDVLVNNAGLGYFDTVVNGKIEEWHNMFDTNVKGLLNCVHVFLPSLIASAGHIVNIGSVASHQVFPNSGIYCATKHAVWAISEAIRLELPDKVRMTTISPGSVNTPFISSTSNDEMLKQYKDYFAAGLSPEIVADQILHAVNTAAGSVITEIIIRPNRQMK